MDQANDGKPGLEGVQLVAKRPGLLIRVSRAVFGLVAMWSLGVCVLRALYFFTGR